MADERAPSVELVADIDCEDESGLSWTFFDEATDPALICEGAWLVVDEGTVGAVAQVVELKGATAQLSEPDRPCS